MRQPFQKSGGKQADFADSRLRKLNSTRQGEAAAEP
jgi:hypothetical protein